MSNKSMPSRSQWLSEMRGDRAAAPSQVQYLHNPNLSGLIGTRTQPGRVARRYVCSIRPLTLGAIAEASGADVLVAVRRESAIRIDRAARTT